MLVCAHKVQRCGKKPAVLIYESILTCLIYKTNKCLKLSKKILFFKESAHLFTKSDLNLHTVLHPSKHFFGNKFQFFDKMFLIIPT